MNHPAPTIKERPREVTLAGTQAVVGSLVAIIVLINGMQELYSDDVREVLADVVATDEAQTLGLTLDGAREILRYSIMVLAVLSTASLVLGFFVLRRHRASRVGLTIIGATVAMLCIAGGPVGWVVTAYIGVSVAMLWSRAARAWFSDGKPPSSEPPGPPPWPPSGPWQGPPPPPPPPPPR